MKLNSTSNEYIARGIPPFASLTLFLAACMFGVGAGTLFLLGSITVLTGAEFIASHFYRTPLDRFFEDGGITVNGKLPQVMRTKKTESGIEYSVKMPPGMDTDDLERLKLSMGQYLDASVKISFKKGMAVITTSKKTLKTLYPYELVQTNKPLEIMLGYDADGEKVFLNIEDAPHVLVAGMTMSGKSVCLRSIATSLLMLKEAELHLVDFQRVELSLFKKYVKSFCSEPLEFSRLLAELKKESDKRLAMFEQAGTVNISNYNAHAKTKLKYIVVIIDEFATLSEHTNIMNSLKIRVAQDRKCGIHYVVCTQRPTTDIISGTLKANIPVRIAFKCADDTNSQVILDTKGAEDLRGKGHGLLLTNELKEFQSMYLSEIEAMELIKPLKVKEGVKSVPKAARQPYDKLY